VHLVLASDTLAAMTKADLIETLREKVPGFTQAETATLVDEVLDIIKNALADGEEIKLTGFGTFDVKAKPARTGRNPQTGEALRLEARRVVRFRPSHLLRARMNASRS
jgi:integration host factor subunit alpha